MLKPCVLPWRGVTAVDHVYAPTRREAWPACETCAELVAAADAAALADRFLASARTSGGVLALMKLSELTRLMRGVIAHLEDQADALVTQ